MKESIAIDVLDSIEQIASERWDSLAGESVGLNHSFLLCREKHFRKPLETRYFHVYTGAETVAVAVAVIEDGKTGFLLTSRLFGRLGAYLRPIGRPLNRAVICGRIPGFGAPIRIRGGTDEQRWIEVICDAMEAYARTRGMSMAYLGVESRQTRLVEALHSRGYLCGVDLPVATLEVTWTDTDSYLKSLRGRSKKYATTARTEMLRFQNSGMRITRFSGSDFSEIYGLLCRHYERKNNEELYFGPDFLKELAARLGDDCIWYVAENATQIVGACMLVRRHDNAMVWLIGVDQEADSNSFSYFNLAYFHPCSEFPQMGIRKAHYGNAAQYAKFRRGCDIEDVEFYLKPAAYLLGPLLRPIFRLQRPLFRRKFRAVLSKRVGIQQ